MQPNGSSSIQALLKQADGALAEGDFRAAPQHYRAARERTASPAQAILGAGRAAFAQADYEEAARQFDFAILANGATPQEVALALAGQGAARLEPARETMEEDAVTLTAEQLDTALSRDPEGAPPWSGGVASGRSARETMRTKTKPWQI